MKKRKKLISGLLMCLLLFSFCCIRLNKNLEEYGQTALKNEVCTEINNSINVYVSENRNLFSELVHHEYNDEGKLCAIELDSGRLGVLQSGLSQTILDTAAELEAASFEVPLGNIFGSRLFSGLGPKIKIKTVPLTTVDCDTVNEFKSVGINHTIHSVELVFTVSFKAAYPFGNSIFETRFAVTLCESIIIGEVPEVYVS